MGVFVMVGMRKKRLVTIKIPGKVTYDEENFKVSTEEQLIKVYCTVARPKPEEIMTYNLDKLTEIMKLRCPWNKVRNIDPQGVKLIINNVEYELNGVFTNVNMLNIEGEFEAKRTI